MISGLVGSVKGDSNRIDTSEFPKVRNESGIELRSTISVEQETENLDGTPIIMGTAAEQVQNEIFRKTIDSEGKITEKTPDVEVETHTTEFALVPGEFVIIESSQGEFAFDMISRATGTSVSPMTFDLDGLARNLRDTANFWMGGFYDHRGSADAGVTYGDQVFDDSEIGSAVWEAKKNQLGIDFEYNSDDIKLRITEGGFVQIFQPGEYDKFSLIRFIDEVLSKYEIKNEEE